MSETDMNERITRLLAYMLRHQPDDFDVELDSDGFGACEDVVRALVERTGDDIQLSDVETAIDGGDRQRYEIVEDRIRALYGHSIKVDAGESMEPPVELFLGLPAREKERMERYGMRGGRRRFLHLSITEAEAKETGSRTAVEYMVVRVNATDAWEQGVDFYDRKSLWLTPELPTYALEIVETYDDGRDPNEGRRSRGDSGGSRGGRGGRGGRGRRDREERPAREERSDREERPAREERPVREERSAPAEPEVRIEPEVVVEAPKQPEAPAPVKPKAPVKKKAPAAAPAVGGFGAGVTEKPKPKAAPKKAAKKAAPKKPKAEPKPEPMPEPPAATGGGFGAGI